MELNEKARESMEETCTRLAEHLKRSSGYWAPEVVLAHYTAALESAWRAGHAVGRGFEEEAWREARKQKANDDERF